MTREIADNLLNPALGAVLLAAFGHKWQEHAHDANIDPWKVFLVLPMALHQPTVNQIATMRFQTGLEPALSSCPSIRSGLQDRVSAFMSLSMRSILFADSCGWLSCGRDCRLHVDIAAHAVRGMHLPSSIKQRLRACERLAAWFPFYSTPQLFALLGVRL
ncbi:MAG: three component ABC system middle component [Planctomycetaceae bacterium]|nr:DUF6521 family protein [Planctomycetaceae bacterium]